MTTISATLTEANIKEAVRDWLEKKGFRADGKMFVTVSVIKGDRPFDSDQAEITVRGLRLASEPTQ